MKLVEFRVRLAELFPHSWMRGICADGFFFPLKDHIVILTWPWDAERKFGEYKLVGPGYPCEKGRFTSVDAATVFIEEQAKVRKLKVEKAMERIQALAKKCADELMDIAQEGEHQPDEAK